MAKIRNLTLPPEINEELIKLLNAVPDNVLAEVGKIRLPGGFTQASAIRERVAGMIRGSASLPSWVMALLHHNAPWGGTLMMLTAAGIKVFGSSILPLVGYQMFLIALLCDPREDVHQLAAELLAASPKEATDEEKRAATLRLHKDLEQYFLVAAGTTVAVPATGAASAEPSKQLSPETVELITKMRDMLKDDDEVINRLKKNLQEQGRKQKAKLEAAARQAGEERKHIFAERDEARVKLRRLTKEKDSLDVRVQSLAAELQTAIARGLDEQNLAITRKWLAAPVETERHLEQTAASGDLFVRVEQALEAQARQDRFTGNRIELERQLADLRQARQRLTAAAQTALAPLPELKVMVAEVDAKITRAELLLHGRSAPDPFTERLLIAINHAATWAEAHQFGQMLQQVMDAELVRKEDRRRVYDALQRKFSLLDASDRPADPDGPDHGWTLRHVIFRNRPSLIILDGHNILYGLEDVFRPHYGEDGHPGRKARERLVGMVRRLAHDRANLRVRVCFDAPRREIIQVTTNVEIEFSGGRGEHRADRRIREHVSWRRPEELNHQWFVVSDDRAVRREAAKNGARYVAVDLFAVLLSDFNCLWEEMEKAA